VPQASQQPPRLTVVSEGPLQGKSYPLQLGNQLVGRGGDADVVIDSPNLSRRHAYLSWDGQRLEIQDAGSTNGTSVDGEWIDASRALRGGELLGLAT
jgi:pSer/pThr/pTyr-binding forkhead associated (FHA) protein